MTVSFDILLTCTLPFTEFSSFSLLDCTGINAVRSGLSSISNIYPLFSQVAKMVLRCTYCQRICLLPEFFEEHQKVHQFQMNKEHNASEIKEDNANKEASGSDILSKKVVDATIEKALPPLRSSFTDASQSTVPVAPQPISYHYSSFDVSNSLQSASSDENSKINCRVCDESFDTHSQRINHSLSHEKVIPCPDCNGVSESVGESEMHELFHQLSYPRTLKKCLLCQGAFIMEHCLKTHISHNHKKHADLSCRKCNSSFSNVYRYQHHILWHIGRSLQICTKFCGLVFDEEEALKEHIASHVNANSVALCHTSSFQCSSCALNFCSAIKLYYHRYLLHNCFKPYNCEKCSKIYFSETHMKAHRCHKRMVSNDEI